MDPYLYDHLTASDAVLRRLLEDQQPELRQLLAALKSIDATNAPLDPAQRAPIEAIRRSAYRLVLRHYNARLFAAPFALRPAPCDLRRLRRWIVERLWREALVRRQSLLLREDGAPLNVVCDSRYLTELAVKLILGAIARNPPGSHISLALWRADGCLLLRVADDGPEPSEETLFDNGESASLMQPQMLAYARRLAEVLGGSLQYERSVLNVYTARLPCVMTEPMLTVPIPEGRLDILLDPELAALGEYTDTRDTPPPL